MFDWKEIWDKKGQSEKTDLIYLSGYEKTNITPGQVAKGISDILNIDSDTAVLEVGCGAGMLAQQLICDYTGVDYSEPLIKKHKQLVGSKLAVAKADNLPFSDEIFNCVFAFSVFQYFPSVEYTNAAISEMLRVCMRGGKIFIGDLPMKSHSEDHLLYGIDDMQKRGFNISNGFYNPDRFNAWKTKK